MDEGLIILRKIIYNALPVFLQKNKYRCLINIDIPKRLFVNNNSILL